MFLDSIVVSKMFVELIGVSFEVRGGFVYECS